MLGAVRRKLGCQGFPASMLGQALERIRPAAAVLARSYPTTGKEMTVREALNSALDEEMSADPKSLFNGLPSITEHTRSEILLKFGTPISCGPFFNAPSKYCDADWPKPFMQKCC